MRHKARYHADYRHIVAHGQGELALEIRLVLFFARGVFCGEVLCNRLVGLGVIYIRIYAVEDAVELILALAQNRIESVAEPGVEYLLCVGRADRGHDIGAFDSTLHQVERAAEIEQLLMLFAETEHVAEYLFAVNALILDIVDGEYVLYALIALAVCVHRRVVDRDESRLPVIRMDDVGLEVNVRDYLKYRAGEERKTLCVVIVTIDAVALEIILVVDKIEDNAVYLRLEDAAVLPTPRDWDGDMCDELHLVAQFLLYSAVERHNNTAADKALAQCLGQRAGNVAEPTARHEGKSFACSI